METERASNLALAKEEARVVLQMDRREETAVAEDKTSKDQKDRMDRRVIHTYRPIKTSTEAIFRQNRISPPSKIFVSSTSQTI